MAANKNKLFIFETFILLLFLIISNTTPVIAGQKTADNNQNWKNKMVLTFYYPWYGIPQGKGGSGQVVHWGKIDPDKKDISASTNYPRLGAYDSYDQKTLNQHCQWVQNAGIDAFIVSWWGHNTYEDKAMPLILDNCRKYNIKACIYYESAQKTPLTTADELITLLEKYQRHPAYLKIGKKPIIFIYGRTINQLGLYNWYETLKIIRKKFKPGIIAIGDQLSYPSAKTFDGIHTYITAGILKDKTPKQLNEWSKQTYPHWVKIARQTDKISTLTVIPGYDDTKIRKPGLKLDRFEGNLYELQWQNALKANPDWILITSFNEWHEGSEIEPSLQYGNKYIEMTSRYVKQFKSLKAPETKQKKIITPAEKQKLKAKIKNLKFAILPEPDSHAFWFLTDYSDNINIVSFSDIAKGKLITENYDCLLYCHGEKYTPSVNEKDDVDIAIQNFLSKGKTLLVLPSAPWPFYYDQNNKTLNNSAKFGLTLKIGWEKPPKDISLKFIQPEHILKHLPKEFDFPKSGDLRWRPLYPDIQHKNYISLLKLTDKKQNYYGDGLAITELKTNGRIVYCWFTLLETEKSEALIYDLITLIAEAIVSSK